MCLLCLSYMLEVVQRRDFIQALAAWSESERSDQLLDNILPAMIVEQLKQDEGRHAIARSYKSVSILFADVVSFTTMSARTSPASLLRLLNRMFKVMDDLAEKNGVEKIKTIGDCYMAAAGLPVQNPDHALALARFGLQVLTAIGLSELRDPSTDERIQLRFGMHSGPCVAGVIGQKKFAYDIWGDAVNTAARMESHGQPMRLHCSSDTYELLNEDFLCEAREPMNVKGKGQMQTYFVVGERGAPQAKSFLTSREEEVSVPISSDSSARSGRSSVMDGIARLSRMVTSLGLDDGLPN